MEQEATQIIAQSENWMIEDNLFDRFMQACEDAPRPNQALLDAADLTQEKGLL